MTNLANHLILLSATTDKSFLQMFFICMSIIGAVLIVTGLINGMKQITDYGGGSLIGSLLKMILGISCMFLPTIIKDLGLSPNGDSSENFTDVPITITPVPNTRPIGDAPPWIF